jgi:hypothetical protein
VTDHPGLVAGRLRGRPPQVEHRVDHRIQLLLRRVPRLQQVVVEVDDVDRLDRGVGVGVRRQQHPAGQREQVHRGLEELDAGHLGHPVVGQQQRDRFTTELQLLQRVERLHRVLRPDDAVLLAVPTAEVTGDRSGNAGIVVHGEDHRAGR